MLIERNPDWLSTKVGDEVVMMSMTSGDYVGLTETASAIWEMIETAKDLDTICAELRREFEVPADVCRPEVEEFVRQMEARGAVLRREPAAGSRSSESGN